MLFKIFGVITIWILSMAGGLLPYCAANRAPKLISLLNIATGGIFMAAGLIDLLPDSADFLQEYVERTEFPLPYLCCATAFILVFMVEEFAEIFAKNLGARSAYDTLATSNESKMEEKHHHVKEKHNHTIYKHATKIHSANDSEVVRPSLRSHCREEEKYVSGSQGMIILIALGFHSVMEGLGLGAAMDNSIFSIFIAIIAHKLLAAFALGTVLYKCYSLTVYVSMMIVFSFATPIGVISGMLLSHGSENLVGTGVCAALAAGTFLHVAAMEIIPQELHNNKHGQARASKLFAMLLGFAIFTCLILVTG